VPVVLRLPPGHWPRAAQLWVPSYTLDKQGLNRSNATAFLLLAWSWPSREQWTAVAQPPRPGRLPGLWLGTARCFFLGTRIEEAPHGASGGAGAGAGAAPPHITTPPANQRLTPPSTRTAARLVSNMWAIDRPIWAC
jgi:hypothetical protein